MPALILTIAERKEHRAAAHHLDPVVLIGQDGLTDAVTREVDAALNAHGLIKVRVFGDDRAQREQVFATLCDTLNAAPIQHIGKLLVLWRPLPEIAGPRPTVYLLDGGLGEDFGHVADKLVSLRLNGPAADDTFAVLVGFRAASLKDLAELDLSGGSITDEGLLQLKGLKNLRRLDLRGTAVGKLGLEAAGWFEHLEFLGLPKGSVGMLARLSLPRRVKLEVG